MILTALCSQLRSVYHASPSLNSLSPESASVDTAPVPVIRSATSKRIVFAVIALLATIIDFSRVAAQDADSDELTREPYVVFVAHDSAYTRCGPGSDYYRTDPLRHGQELDVYVETADGWLGVRPPENSFCWIPASATQSNSNGDTATIVEDKSVAWIGTHLGRARQYQWQVQLSKGESVTIIGKSERDGPDGPQTWYRIVPPSGEFRWIHQDQIVHSSEELVASLQRIAEKGKTQTVKESNDRPKVAAYDRGPAELPIAEIQPASVSSETDSFQAKVSRSELSDDASSRRSADSESRSTSGLTIAEIPTLAPAPMPSRPTSASAAPTEVIGSGVDQTSLTQPLSAAPTPAPVLSPLANVNLPAPVRDAVDAAARFVGQPRLFEIGNENSVAPHGSEIATNNNWTPASPRMPASLIPASSPQQYAQVTNHTEPPRPTSVPQRTRTVAQENIVRVEDAIRGADLDQLQLVFSRLMAEAASAEEVAPVAREVSRMVNGGDPAQANRAREVAERITRYQLVAARRDGNTVILPSNPAMNLVPTPQVPSNNSSGNVQLMSATSTPAIVPINDTAAERVPRVGEATGYLVQVYSSRANSPPYALTDESGATLTYVTPYPGVNLRPHLNSEITVRGNQGYLQGVNTPHVLVTEAMRSTRR
ncbi:SH3 domain-containing protein [Stieleria varia]|uniref:Uncharacterized protein n=1 Tax=Stieleria varia TaxID=2528005 RepID=A0A5C5ZWV5_9BACT|nr:hypothetical protein [Stieleria varia]TWT91511.1 hypothetical protein Pla52n_66020 [Stieleria varia]